MRRRVTLITGANGEVGHGLIHYLAQHGDTDILALDVRDIAPELRPMVRKAITGDILNTTLLERLMSEYEFDAIFHLAALLSTRAEFTPEAAHRVNVQGTINLLHMAIEQSRWQGRGVKFIFPSSIAAYGLPELATKQAADPIREEEYNVPVTMYGCNKLYCEHLGHYYANFYRQLAPNPEEYRVDFRCLRYPGLISAATLPSGGTSDYVPEMIHAAAQGKAYAAFVRPDTIIPFMVMPDAITSLLRLAEAPRERLTKYVYNVTGFSISAAEAAEIIQAAFPEGQLRFEPDERRQGILDTWPAELDDSAARADWGWQPEYARERAFTDYLIPALRARYA
ncbi:MAG: NAD-dependent epimerase/dehydratase family protein [Anaerolineales bacterium]